MKCSVDSWECHGSNVLVLFLTPSIKVASNISNFVVERTKILYGVKLMPKDSLLMSAGVAFALNPGLEYDVHITIDKCYVMFNIQPRAAHLYFRIYSSCTILVKDSTFGYACKQINRK